MEEYTINDLYAMLIDDESWESDEIVRKNVTEVLKAIIVNAE